MKRFEEGYVCRSCFRELEKAQRLQAQLDELKGNLLTKVEKAANSFPTTSCTGNETPVRASRKRPAVEAHLSSEQRKRRRRILQAVECAPTTSAKDSPDVSVS